MKFTTIVVFATSVAAVAVNFDVARRDTGALVPRHHQGQAANGRNSGGNGRNNANNNNNNNNNNNDNNTDAGSTDDNSNTDDTADDGSTSDDTADNAATGDTVVLTEIGGIPGNECLTFRNNGEIVDAACVNEAADRQMTPSTINGASALSVQRAFDAGFRADLVNAAACVGFNGTHFLAADCSDSNFELVSFSGGELRAASGACASGHDDLAQMTVDTSGQSCAQYTSTAVTPTPP